MLKSLPQCGGDTHQTKPVKKIYKTNQYIFMMTMIVIITDGQDKQYTINMDPAKEVGTLHIR